VGEVVLHSVVQTEIQISIFARLQIPKTVKDSKIRWFGGVLVQQNSKIIDAFRDESEMRVFWTEIFPFNQDFCGSFFFFRWPIGC
jgi:hypothetical protein